MKYRTCVPIQNEVISWMSSSHDIVVTLGVVCGSRTGSGSRSTAPACWVFRPQDVAARRTRFLLPLRNRLPGYSVATRHHYSALGLAINICFIASKVGRTGGVLLLVKSLLFSHRPATYFCCSNLSTDLSNTNVSNFDQWLAGSKRKLG